MSRTAFAFLGVVVLGISAGAVYRELTSTGKRADGTVPRDGVTRGAAETGQAENARALPDIRFVDGAGTPRSMSDFRGRVILLNLWATWCVPCRKEMPALDRLQAALGGPGFEVVALSIDQGGIAAVKRFYTELDLRALRIYIDQKGDALAKLGSVGIPLTALVDRDGRELWRVLGPREWDQPAELERVRRHLGQKDK